MRRSIDEAAQAQWVGHGRSRLAGALAVLLHRWPELTPAASIAHRMTSSRWRLSPSPVRRVGRLQSGSRIVLDCRDHAQWHIYFYGSHEEPTTRLVGGLLRRGDVVLDVGANAGYYSLLASDLGCETHAFEPQPTVVALLRESIALNCAHVTVVEAACGSERGRATLFTSLDPQFTGLATLRRDAVVDTRPAMAHEKTVPVTTIDDYCAERNLAPRLVKIDVEGFECSVLEGATRILERCRPHVVCEIKDARASELLASFGYGAYPLDDADNVHFVPPT